MNRIASRISIVTPSYNQDAFLLEALESVRSQAHCDVEHLVFDGGSTDGSVKILESFAGHSAWSHLHWQSGPDEGQSDALNRGFVAATGGIVGWLNSDDRYRKGCFEHVLRAFDENPDVDIFYGDYTIIDAGGKVVKVRREIEFNRFILTYHHVLTVPTPSTFFRRRIFDEGNLLRHDLHYAMDYEFFVRLAAKGYRIQHLPRLLADFRLHPESKTSTGAHLQSKEKLEAMYAHSPLGKRLHNPALRRPAFFLFQTVAALLRWSEKLVRGAYSNHGLSTIPRPLQAERDL